MKTINILLLLLTIISFNKRINAQISEGGSPASFSLELGNDIASYNINPQLNEPFYISRLDTIEIDSNEFDTVTMFDPVIGDVVPFELNLLSSGTWSVLQNGDSILRINLTSSAGMYLMLIFNDFYLPEGSKLYVYSKDKTKVLGAFTHVNNNQYNKFSIAPIKNKDIIIEFIKPIYSATGITRLSVSSVGVINKDLMKLFKSSGLGSSQACMINSKCSEYEHWCNQRRSVALIIRVIGPRQQLRWCTGSLLTNERRDGKPFFLTAFHCLDNDGEDGNGKIDDWEKDEVRNWLFIFNYQSENCDNPSTDPSLFFSISGSQFIDAHKKTDYALLQLNQKPPKNYNAFYNGWSNDKDDMTETGVTIHHPSGDIKKISEWEKKLSLPNKWRVDYTKGNAEPGSSGAPLFNRHGYVLGQLIGGLASCDNNHSDYYGRFDKSWHKFGLSWPLNPNGTHSGNQFYISRMLGDETCKENWHFNNCNDLHTSGNVSFINMASVETRMYDGYYNAKYAITAMDVSISPYTQVVFEAGQEIILQAGFQTQYQSTFTAIIGDCERGCGNGFKKTDIDYSDMKIFSGKPENNVNAGNLTYQSNNVNSINVSPNPTDGLFTLSSNINTEETIQVNVHNSLGKVLLTFKESSHSLSQGMNINLSDQAVGIYLVTILTANQFLTTKIILR